MWGMGNLNAKKIRELRIPGRYGDGNGLYLHVREGGSRQWVLRTTVQGRRRDISLGSVDIVSLADARDKAHELRKAAKQGLDPLDERRKGEGVPTYQEAAEVVWRENRETWKNRKHAEQWINTQRTYAFPIIGSMRIDQITPSDIQRVLNPIWLEKEETARRLKQRMQKVFKWAKVVRHYSGDNPMEGIVGALAKQGHKVRHHSALDWRELPSFAQELREAVDRGVAANALFLLILTALRSSEVRLATWDEIDWDGKVWVVPASRMKMKREHRVPLSPQAIAILERCREFGSDYIFPSDRPTKHLSGGAFARLIERMGRSGFTPHGFRSTFRDWCSDNNAAPREVAEKALAHLVGDRTEQAYARSDLFEQRKKLMDEWASYVFSADQR